MSLNLNSVTLAGRLTRDVEVKMLSGDRAVASMGLAINRTWKDKDGTKKEEATFIEVTAWGKTAEHCGQYLRKGSAVFIEGRLKQDAWKTKDGEARQMLKVEAHNVQFLDPLRNLEGEPVPVKELPPKRTVTNAVDPFADEPGF